MRVARSIVVGVGLLLLAHSASGSSRAAATAGASVTIIEATSPNIELPATLSLSRTGRHTIPLPRRVNRAPALPSLSILADSPDASVRLLDGESGAVLEIDVVRIPLRNVALPLQVTYHQY